MAAALVLAGLFALLPAAAQRNRAASYATVGGTVFREPGLSLGGAKVELLLRTDSKTRKIQEIITNDRGEFAFRVPAADVTYVLRATMKGYKPEEKEATISGEETIDVNLVLSPVSK